MAFLEPWRYKKTNLICLYYNVLLHCVDQKIYLKVGEYRINTEPNVVPLLCWLLDECMIPTVYVDGMLKPGFSIMT